MNQKESHLPNSLDREKKADAIPAFAPKVLSATLVGTSMMTLFSYLVSRQKKDQFREPELLAKLISRMWPNPDKATSHVAGWVVHYGVGLAFATAYHLLWRRRKPTIANGMLLGAISGGFGMLVWNTVLKLHPKPPAVNKDNFMGHLLAAHIVFGAGTAVGYKAAPTITKGHPG